MRPKQDSRDHRQLEQRDDGDGEQRLVKRCDLGHWVDRGGDSRLWRTMGSAGASDVESSARRKPIEVPDDCDEVASHPAGMRCVPERDRAINCTRRSAQR
jgi:hypothetical protein